MESLSEAQALQPLQAGGCALSFKLIKIDKIPSFGLIHNSIQQFPAGGKITNQFVCVSLCGSVAN